MNAGSIFQALADPTRRQILCELKNGEMSAGEIVALFEMTAPSVSRHLSILTHAGLVGPRRDGNRILYSLQSESLITTLNDFLSAACPTQIKKRKALEKKKKREVEP